jgi:hypothetical protein
VYGGDAVLTLPKLILAAVIMIAIAVAGSVTPVNSLHLLAFQSPPADPEGGDPEPGKPAQCDNHKSTPEAHKCHCLRDRQKCSGLPEGPADVRMDKSCLTYCREQKCYCAGHGCRS